MEWNGFHGGEGGQQIVSGERNEENWPPALKHESHQCLVLTVFIGSEQDSSKEIGGKIFTSKWLLTETSLRSSLGLSQMVPMGGQKEMQKALSLPTVGAFSEWSRESTMPQTLEVERNELSVSRSSQLTCLTLYNMETRKEKKDKIQKCLIYIS